jgi:FAD/FMN-containing dehydrogenase
MEYLKNRLPDTDILQEYFVEPDKMPEFVDGLRDIVTSNKANLLNVTIRIVQKDTITTLPYAKQDMLSFVLYFNQKFNTKDSEILQKTTIDLIDLVNSLDGTYYLPYQLYYSKDQLIKAYPEIDRFFIAKRTYDSQEIFQNKFYQKYGKEQNELNEIN